MEISSFDLRFEDYRLRNQTAERILLASISEKGVRDPLQGVDMDNARILLNGFKRYAQRVHEKLTEEHNVAIGYSTLTGIIRDLGLRKRGHGRCDQVACQL